MSFQSKRKFEHLCGNCVHYPLCKKINVKNAPRNCDYCLWEEDYYKEMPDG